jgi:serine/threonine protein kinase
VIGEYTIGKKLGIGNFAEVHEAYVHNEMTQDTHTVAVKIVSKKRNPTCPAMLMKEQEDDETMTKEFQSRLTREINIWRQAKHPNIVQLFETQGKFAQITDYISRLTLFLSLFTRFITTLHIFLALFIVPFTRFLI